MCTICIIIYAWSKEICPKLYEWAMHQHLADLHTEGCTYIIEQLILPPTKVKKFLESYDSYLVTMHVDLAHVHYK